jgi:Carbohydrate family 9 binding domain-like
VDQRTKDVFAIFSHSESAPDTDPQSLFWAASVPITFDADTHGTQQADLRTEVRCRWTFANLYLLFSCVYSDDDPLYLKPDPDLRNETNELWNWDVAEVFLGADPNDIRRYKEVEISPQGEWVDVDVNLNQPHHEQGWVWRSGCEVATRIDDDEKIWFGFVRIPYASVDSRPAAAGNALRVNFCRAHGVGHRLTVWQSTMSSTFHVPEVFGTLTLA